MTRGFVLRKPLLVQVVSGRAFRRGLYRRGPVGGGAEERPAGALLRPIDGAPMEPPEGYPLGEVRGELTPAGAGFGELPANAGAGRTSADPVLTT
jgi:hypothetical protein